MCFRFLPCNSHHIRDHNQQQPAQQNAQPASRRSVSLDRGSRTANVPPVPARASSSCTSSATAFDPFGSLRRAPMRIKDSTVVQVTQEEYTKKFTWFGVPLTLQDLDDVNPTFFNNLRQELRQHFIENYFEGQEIDDSLIATVRFYFIYCLIISMKNFCRPFSASSN